MTTPSDPQPPPEPASVSPPPDSAGGSARIEPRRLHVATPLAAGYRTARQILIFSVFLGLSTGDFALILGIAVVLIVVMLGLTYLGWARTTYGLADGVLRVDSGILSRTRREVPLTRIQQVDLHRPVVHRIFGLVILRVDTAGGGGQDAEVVLNALADDEAAALRGLLLSHRTSGAPAPTPGPSPDGGSDPTATVAPGLPPPPPPPPAPPPEPVVQLTNRQLVVAGVTGRHLGAVVVFVGALYGLLGYLPSRTVESTAESTWAWIVGSVLVVAALSVVGVAVWLVAAAIASVVQDHDFTLVTDGTDLHMRRGLLQQREATLALNRVHAVRITDNPLRRRLGLVAVQIQSAGGDRGQAPVAKLTIPVLPVAELPRILDLVLPGAPATPALTPHPLAARSRWRFRAVTPVVAVVVPVTLVTGAPAFLVGLVAVAPAWWWAGRYHRSLGHAVTPGHLVSRWGALFRNTAVLPLAKVQGCRVVASPFQRRVGLASLRVAVAGDRFGVPVADAGTERLGEVRHELLESRASRLDEQATRRRLAASHAAAV